jgi:hypothetical protein
MCESVRLDSSQLPAVSNKIPPNTLYRALVRGPTSSLPGVHSGNDKQSFATKALQEAFLKIHRGDFVLEWNESVHEDDQDDDNVEEKQPTHTLTMIVSLHNDEKNDDNDEEETGTSASSSSRLFGGGERLLWVTCTASGFGLKMRPVDTEANRHGGTIGKLFLDSLTTYQREALSCRIFTFSSVREVP